MPINPSFRLTTKITCWVLVAALLASCSTASRTPIQPVNIEAEATFSDLDPRLHVIGVHVDGATPQVDVGKEAELEKPYGNSAGTEALIGAAGGAVGGLVGCFNFARLPWVGAILMAACLPFGLVGGAAVGSARAGKTTNANSDQSLDNRLKSYQAVASSDMLQALEEYAKFNGIPTFRITSSRSASTSPPNRVLTILDVKIVRISYYLANSIGIQARVTVYTLPERMVADSYTLVMRPSDEFRNDDAALFKRAYREIAHAALDESMLVYRHEGELVKRPESYASETGISPFPNYTLRPLAPPFIGSSLDQRQRNVFIEQESSVDPLQPVFRWESLPIIFSSDPSIKDRIRDITYEFVLHSGRPYFNQGFVPREVPEFTIAGLTEPQFEMGAALLPCTHYFWSVRAHFMLDNQPRVTEWSGAYNLGGSAVTPSLFRRNGDTSLRNAMFYPEFRTQGQCGVPTYKVEDSVPHDPREYYGISGKAWNQP